MLPSDASLYLSFAKVSAEIIPQWSERAEYAGLIQALQQNELTGQQGGMQQNRYALNNIWRGNARHNEILQYLQ